MPTPDDVKARVTAAYDRAADAYDHASNSFWERYGRRTIDRLALPRGARVLDLCCGSGASAIPAAERVGDGGRVVGVDLSAALLRLAEAKAARLGLRHVELRAGDVLDPRHGVDAPAPFDVVVCVFGLFFLPDMVEALRTFASFVRAGGEIAITTWGKGLFEPVDAHFWEAVARVRPDLVRAFQPWDRLGEPHLLHELFAAAGLPPVAVELEPGRHAIRGEDDLVALLTGTGYRGTLEQLRPEERSQVRNEVLAAVRARSIHDREIRTDVLYARGRSPA